jgi:hypothetical protein
LSSTLTPTSERLDQLEWGACLQHSYELLDQIEQPVREWGEVM